MSEVVVDVSPADGRDLAGLMQALDAFAKWAVESSEKGAAPDDPDFMMITETCDGRMRRKLVFQDRNQAAKFLMFWRTGRRRSLHQAPWPVDG